MAAEPIFDAAEGERRRDASLAQVADNARAEWLERAFDAVQRCAESLSTFTTDDVWKALAACDVSTHERRAMGAVIRRAAEASMIEPTDDYRATERAEAHRGPKRVWRSRIYVEGWAA
jgi:hypothetical protein